MTTHVERSTIRITAEAVSVEDLVAAIEGGDRSRPPSAASVISGVPFYNGSLVAAVADGVSVAAADGGSGDEAITSSALMAEWAQVLLDGPGVLAVKGSVPADVIDEATSVFEAILAEERAAGQSNGDHFATPGSNDRIWNVLEKHCLQSPESFARYYADPAVAMAAESWLGPGYQMTAQVNVVNPGGAAQQPHRDYHLGFMTNRQAAGYPVHAHRFGPMLTLQGAVAHTDMPLETGPTFYLPFSQRYELGYLAWRNDDVKAYVAEHQVQLPLEKGDVLFFNPAVFHGAGANRTADARRIGNLLQISSPFGRAMEHIDRRAMVRALYPVWRRRWDAGERGTVVRSVGAAAEGYAFPGDLDRDQPRGDLAPPADAELVLEALADGRDELELPPR